MPKEVTKQSHSYSYFKTNAREELFHANISTYKKYAARTPNERISESIRIKAFML